jgi:hypothetical protein
LLLLPTGFPLYPEFTGPAYPAVVGKAQEVKDGWFAFALPGRIFCCKSTEGNDFQVF